ncbi:MAG: Bud site selection protein 20 [Caeruleum heppii]|nr:MAG: Bud site selection protein 20 [Caeruleum heppii]
MGSIRRSKTKRRTRDLDQVHADLRDPKHLAQHQATKAKEDLPGLGEWYCRECAKHYASGNSIAQHRRSKKHKRRYDQPRSHLCFHGIRLIAFSLRMLLEEPYSQKEAEAAAGLGSYNLEQRKKIHSFTQGPLIDIVSPPEAEMNAERG